VQAAGLGARRDAAVRILNSNDAILRGGAACRLCGTREYRGRPDLTEIPGISDYTAITLLSEIGTDMSCWGSVKKFAAWLRLAPGTKITGGKVLSARTLPTSSRAAQVLRTAAVNAGRTRTALGSFYRRMCLQRGSGRVVVATAHKIARIIFQMISTGMPFQEVGQDAYEQQHRDRTLRRLKKQAADLGLALVPDQQAVLVS